MYKTTPSRRFGFVLIEALIALMLISVGLVAVSKLQVLSLSGAGEAKSRSEAALLSQRKLEELRNILLRGNFTGAPLASSTATVVGTNATYAMTWTVSAPSSTLEQRLLRLTTTWTDARNVAQRLDLNSLIAWDDPGSQAKLNLPPGGALIAPTGSAQRGSGAPVSTTGSIQNSDGSRILVANGKTSLLSSAGNELLVLPAKNGSQQYFTTITGRVFFDQNAANNSIPNSNNVRVRLSSEGECIFNNSVGNLLSASGGSNSYKYFTYTCYVGPGWYGNVGVLIDDSVTGQAGSPTICVGDPAFNGGVSDSTLISAHPAEAATRSYRGFKGTTGAYFSTGMEGGRKYGLSSAPVVGVSTQVAPFDGRPLPSAYPSYYPTVTVGGSTDYFDQDFLVTHITGSGSCYAQMTGGVFTRNAGQYFCINRDNDPAADVCPPIWPGFSVGSGGSINYTLTVAKAGSGTGSVTSAPTGISCGSTCSASFATGTVVALTPVEGSGSNFIGWNGCATVVANVCTVTVTSASTVTATFGVLPSYTLTATKTGTGSGTITSSDTLINCGSACSASYVSGSTVTLTAGASSGSTFGSWTACPTAVGNTCTVSISSATTVTASFTSTPGTYTLTVAKTGTGAGGVTSADGFINCGSTCSSSYASGATVVLTATATSGTFSSWTGCTSSLSNVCTVLMTAAANVTANFAPPASYSLTVTKAGTGTGVVTSSPSGISCGTGCSTTFVSPTSVTLTAVPDAGSAFTGWSGSGCTGTGACTVAMTTARSVTATFATNALCASAFSFSGTAHDNFGTVTITGNTSGSCAMQGGNSSGYTCTGLNAPTGTVFTLTNSRTTGNASDQYSYTLGFTNSCSTPTNVNFP